MGCAAGVGGGTNMPTIGRRSAVVIVHLARLDCVGWRQPRAIEKSDRGLGAKAAHAAAARITEWTQRLAIEEISRPTRQSTLHGGRRLGRYHVEQLKRRTGRLKSRRFARREQNAGALLRWMRRSIEADAARFRRLDDVDKVVVVARVHVQLATWQHRPLVDGERL